MRRTKARSSRSNLSYTVSLEPMQASGETLTGCASESNTLWTNTKWETLAEVYPSSQVELPHAARDETKDVPRSRAPEHREGEDMQDGECDQRVASAPVCRGKLRRIRIRNTGWWKGEMSDKTSNQRAYCFENGACKEGVSAAHAFDEEKGGNSSHNGNTAEYSLNRIGIQSMVSSVN